MVFDSVSGPWTELTPGSVSRLNKMTVISGPGSDLAALTKTLHVLYKCTETGSGLTIDHVYQTSTDGTSLIDLSAIASHTHASTAQGGELVDIFSGNPKFIDTGGVYIFDDHKSRWIETISGTGSTADDTDGLGQRALKMLTGATSGSGASFQQDGFTLDFSKRSTFQVKAKIGQSTSVAVHIGVNADLVTAVDSNTAKYNAEICTVTNNNWFLRSATGSAKTSSDSGIAFTVVNTGIRLEHYPTAAPARVDMQIDANTLFQKTSDVPTSGTSAVTNLMTHSIKNSTAANRDLYIHGCRLRYTTNDAWV